MTQDNVVVQQGAVQGTASTDGQNTQTAQPAPIDAQVAEMIQAKVAEEVRKATEAARREIQSVKDRSRAEIESAQRRARLAETTLGETKTRVKDLDPDVAKEMELVELRARVSTQTMSEQEEQTKRAQLEFQQQFYSGLNQFVSALGVDPNDTRIDWGTDAANYLEAQTRVLNSVAKIQKEAQTTAQSSWEKRLKTLEEQTKKAENIEVNSVNTTTSSGVVAGSDAEFLKQFASGAIPVNKGNIDRYNKILKT